MGDTPSRIKANHVYLMSLKALVVPCMHHVDTWRVAFPLGIVHPYIVDKRIDSDIMFVDSHYRKQQAHHNGHHRRYNTVRAEHND